MILHRDGVRKFETREPLEFHEGDDLAVLDDLDTKRTRGKGWKMAKPCV